MLFCVCFLWGCVLIHGFVLVVIVVCMVYFVVLACSCVCFLNDFVCDGFVCGYFVCVCVVCCC